MGQVVFFYLKRAQVDNGFGGVCTFAATVEGIENTQKVELTIVLFPSVGRLSLKALL